MDEELEQRGVTPESFFDQATETRETVQAVQKTSNSNLSLLNELKERVRKIEVKLFDEEDRRQKEEMEAKVKEQNEKAEGASLGDKGGVKEPEQKGLMGQVGSFLSNFIGGIVGGSVGFTLAGIGGMIGGVVNLGKKALDLGKNFREKLFGKKKKDKKGGKVKTDKLMGVVEEEEEEDKDKEKKEKGQNIFGRVLGGIKKIISDFDGTPGSRETKDTKGSPKGEIKEEEVKEEKPKFYADYINEGAEISEIGPGDFSIIYPDGRSTILSSVGMGGGGETLEERFNDNVKGIIQYDKEKKERDLEFGKRMHKNFPDKYNSDGTRKKSKTKDKKKDRRGILGMIGGGIDKLTGNLTDFDRRGGKTFGATRVATGMLDFVTADMFDLDKRGKMDLFGMRKNMKNKKNKEAFENNPNVKNFRKLQEHVKNPTENLVIETEDGRTLRKGDEGFEEEYNKHFNSKEYKKKEQELKKIEERADKESKQYEEEIYKKHPELLEAFEFNQGGLVQKYNQGGEVDSVPAMLTPGEFVVTKDAVEKVGADTLKGLNASVGATNKPSLSNLEVGFGGVDMSLFEKKQTSVGGLDSSFMIDGEKQYLTPSQIKKQLTKMNVPYKELLNGMVIPDAAKIAAAEEPKWYDTTRQVITETVPDGKMRENMINELDKFMKNFTGSGGDFRDTSQIESEMNRYIPGTIENLGLQITESANKNKPKKKGLFQTQNFNEGGLVQPVIESKNESGEMELIQNLSQSVGSNSQNINVIQAQTQAMNPPNNNPQTTVPAEPSNTTLTGLQDTDAPIPFAMLLKQNAQRYLNLGNNAMVIS